MYPLEASNLLEDQCTMGLLARLPHKFSGHVDRELCQFQIIGAGVQGLIERIQPTDSTYFGWNFRGSCQTSRSISPETTTKKGLNATNLRDKVRLTDPAPPHMVAGLGEPVAQG